MDNLMIFQRKFQNKFSSADDPITSKLHFISAKLAPQASYHPHKNSNSYQSNQNDDTCLISLVNFWAVHSVNGLVEAAAASEHREEQDEQSVACRTERQRMVLQVILPAKENRQEDEEEEEEEEANLA